MTYRAVLSALAWIVLWVQPTAWAASAGEQWTAVSTTAISITEM
jgi:hypothetical protein